MNDGEFIGRLTRRRMNDEGQFVLSDYELVRVWKMLEYAADEEPLCWHLSPFAWLALIDKLRDVVAQRVRNTLLG